VGLRGRLGGSALLAWDVAESSRPKSKVIPWTKRGLTRPEMVAAFVEWLPVTKGPLAGERMRLLPGQRQFIEEIYGNLDRRRRRKRRIGVKSEPKGNGKGLALGTPLPTPAGWTTMGAVQPGDALFDDAGNECRVTMVSPVRLLDCYRITFSNGEKIIADGDHRWLTLSWPEVQRLPQSSRGEPFSSKAYRVRDTRELYRTQTYGAGFKSHRLQLTAPFSGRWADLPVDPYVLGAWLGDGDSHAATITAGTDDAEEMAAELRATGLAVDIRQWGVGRAPTLVLRAMEERADGTNGPVAKRHSANLQKTLGRIGVLGRKHIPSIYLRASREQREALLQGLMDTDGFCSKRQGQAEFLTTSETLAEGFVELLATFGIKYRRTLRETAAAPAYRFTFTAHRNQVSLFRLARKSARQLSQSGFASDPTRGVMITSVERVDPVPTKCLQVDSPSRLFLCGRTMLPTHNTGLIAGLCLCHLVGPEAEDRGEIYSAAIDRQMAALIFAEMEAIIYAVPEFAEVCNIIRFNKKIEVQSGPGRGSIYEALSADARRAHGLSPTLFCYDELAQAKDRVLLDNLVNGLGKRKEALGLIISTQAPDDTHPLSQLIDEGLRGDDPSLYVQLTAAPPDADPFAEATWKACNPALGKFLSLDEMRTAADRARRIPAFEASFRNLRLNQRIDAAEDERLVTQAVWKLGVMPVDRAALRGRVCYAALDLSGKHDLTALVLAFPNDDPEPSFDLLPFFWTPQGSLTGRQQRERERFQNYIAKGHMVAVPGATVRFSFVAAALVELAQEFDIRVVGYDRWRIDDFREDLRDIDANFAVPLEPFGQGFKEMSPAIEWFGELAMTGRLRHGGHPVLGACMAGSVIVNDAAGNQKIDKEKSHNRGPVRVDGAVAAVMALELAKRSVGRPPEYQMFFLGS